MTRDQAAAAISILDAAYPNYRNQRADTIPIYRRFLEPLDYEHAVKAIEIVIADHNDFPHFAAIREVYDNLNPRTPVVCPECEIGGGHHLADCSRA